MQEYNSSKDVHINVVKEHRCEKGAQYIVDNVVFVGKVYIYNRCKMM